MNRPILLLNADYQPIGMCGVQNGFCLVYLGKAEILEQYSKGLRTVDKEYPYPSIIKLKKYVKRGNMKSFPVNRMNVFRRDGYKCGYCGSKHDLTVDHVIPLSKGGKNTWDNVVTACFSCNSKKGDRTPAGAGMKLDVKLREPSSFMDLYTLQSLPESWLPYIEPYKKVNN